MPNRDRVDELESEVDELKGTVQGLTEELVEAHERIRQIERALAGDANAARDAAREAASEAATDVEEAIRGADPQEVAEAAARAEEELEDVSTAGTATEPQPGPEATEGDKVEGSEGGDEAEGDGDGIIVA
jgi:phage shock protein A